MKKCGNRKLTVEIQFLWSEIDKKIQQKSAIQHLLLNKSNANGAKSIKKIQQKSAIQHLLLKIRNVIMENLLWKTKSTVAKSPANHFP